MKTFKDTVILKKSRPPKHHSLLCSAENGVMEPSHLIETLQ